MAKTQLSREDKFFNLCYTESMSKVFTVTGKCIPEKNYMVNIDDRILKIRKMVENGDYFCINRGRQYGKTTTFSLLKHNLSDEYAVFSISFEGADTSSFSSLSDIGKLLFSSFARELKSRISVANLSDNAKEYLLQKASDSNDFTKESLSDAISELCDINNKPVVLLIDEVDQASNYESFLQFLSLLRAKYLSRDSFSTLHSVILAGVYDIKNLKLKLRPNEGHMYNSPWNIAADFNINMALESDGIKAMLDEYASDNNIKIDTAEISNMIFDYTSGYPFLVSRLCQIMDVKVPELPDFNKETAWSKEGFLEAVKIILKDENTLFDDMRKKLNDFPPMRQVIFNILYNGQSIPFNAYDTDLNIAKMFGFIKDNNGKVAVSNRIFEVWFYNLFVTEEAISNLIYNEGSKDHDLFIKNNELDMPLILERFIVHFNDIYGDKDSKFVENEGRKYFLFFLKPIINGTGNYYVEAQTRNERRTDVIVDYCGHQYIIELKIWHGEKYNENGEQQLCDYLDYHHQNTGYMLTFNFNENKTSKITKVEKNGKTIYEAFV